MQRKQPVPWSSRYTGPMAAVGENQLNNADQPEFTGGVNAEAPVAEILEVHRSHGNSGWRSSSTVEKAKNLQSVNTVEAAVHELQVSRVVSMQFWQPQAGESYPEYRGGVLQLYVWQLQMTCQSKNLVSMVLRQQFNDSKCKRKTYKPVLAAAVINYLWVGRISDLSSSAS